MSCRSNFCLVPGRLKNRRREKRKYNFLTQRNVRRFQVNVKDHERGQSRKWNRVSRYALRAWTILQFVPKFPHNPKTCTARLSTKEAGLSIDLLRSPICALVLAQLFFLFRQVALVILIHIMSIYFQVPWCFLAAGHDREHCILASSPRVCQQTWSVVQSRGVHWC